MTSRNRLLDAGVALLTEHPDVLVRRGVTAEAVAHAAGVTRRTFYDQFEAVELYLEALAEHLAAQVEELRHSLAFSLTDVDGDLRRLLSDAVADHLVRQHTASRLVLALSLIGSTSIIGIVDDPWDSIVDQLQTLGLRAVSASPTELVAAIRQQVRGAITGSTAPPSPELIASTANAVEHLLGALAEPTEEFGSTDSATRRHRIATLWNESQNDLSVPNVRVMATDAAELLLLQRGPLALSVDALSGLTGLSRSMIVRHIGGTEGLLSDIVDEVSAGLEARMVGDLQHGLDTGEALDRHFSRIVELRETRPAYGLALLILDAQRSDRTAARASLDAVVRARLLGALDDPARSLIERLIEVSALVPWNAELKNQASEWLRYVSQRTAS